jgi:Holliday junction resolvase
MKNRYRSGRIHEGKVATNLGSRGWTNIRRSKGSRGPADLYARTPSGTRAYIQVKSGTASVSKREVRDLRALAKSRKGVAVTAVRRDGKTKFRFLGNWRKRKA